MPEEVKRLTAYNRKNKEKNVPIYNAVINITTNGNRKSVIVQGTTEDGSSKLASVTSLAKAEEAINAGVAARGSGWD